MSHKLIVGGPARSGTRFATDACNRHPDVVLQGEADLDMIERACRLILLGDKRYKKDEERWFPRRASFFMSMITFMQRSEIVEGVASIEGFKRPYVERQRELLRQVWPSHTFLYCLRNFHDHWLSCANRWPERDIATYASAYIDSIGHAEAMLADPDIKVVAFSLDRLSSEGERHLNEIGTRLGLSDPEGWAAQIDPGRKVNQAEKFTHERRTELLSAEREFIDARPELEQRHNDFWDAYDAMLA